MQYFLYLHYGPKVGVCCAQGRLYEMKIEKPTQVQIAAIPKVLSGSNVAIQCYTGSGKVLNAVI